MEVVTSLFTTLVGYAMSHWDLGVSAVVGYVTHSAVWPVIRGLWSDVRNYFGKKGNTPTDPTPPTA